MADEKTELGAQSGKGVGCVTFLTLFVFVAMAVMTNGPAILQVLGWGNATVGPGDGDKLRLLVAVDRTAAPDAGEAFVLRRWGSTERPFKLEKGESLTISQREVKHGNDVSDVGDRGRTYIRVLEQGPQGQLIETSYGASVADWKFTYRVDGTSVTPVSFKSTDAGQMLALLLISIVLTVVLNRLLTGLFRRGSSDDNPDKAPPSGA
jgi:hypothetical protein